jgi:hypothetical protein
VIGGLPVREFRWYQGRQHYSGWSWSSTMGRHIAYESRLELARIMLADFDPVVSGLAAQLFARAVTRGPSRMPAESPCRSRPVSEQTPTENA